MSNNSKISTQRICANLQPSATLNYDTEYEKYSHERDT